MSGREIKFRAWDKKNNTMLENILYEVDPVGFFDERFYEVMQYTGLKDKNGVEIYEGDIIVCHKCDAAIYEIKWYDGKNDFIGQLGWNIIASEAEEVEVIGNIYENKELLK